MNTATAPRLEYLEREDCWICGHATDSASWVNRGTHFVRNIENIILVQVCCLCARFEEAMIEADIESRRYTEVELQERCICGRVIHSLLGTCVMCWRERRMISKELRELKLTRAVMLELKRRSKQRGNDL